MSRGRVAVVGGGIAGLAAAWEAVRNGAEVTLYEQAPAVGGKIAATTLDTSAGAVTVDAGAEAFLARRPEVRELATEIGLAGEIVAPATTAARVWSRGRLYPLPAGTVLGIPAGTDGLAGLLTAAEVARVGAERSLPALTRVEVEADVGVGELVARRLGDAVVDRLVEPLLGGVYAGHARALSLAAVSPALHAALQHSSTLLDAAAAVAGRGAGASLAAAGPVFGGLRGGVARLPAALAAALTMAGVTVYTAATVRALARSGSGWRLTWGETRAERVDEVDEVDAVVLATPAAPTARLLASAGLAGAAAAAAGIPYASIGIVLLSVDAADALRRAVAGTSGVLVPPVEARTVKAATWSSTKWGWLAESAAGAVVLRASVGRYGEEATLARPDPAIVADVLADLQDLLDVDLTGLVRDARVVRWGGALPQYAPGHLDRVAALRGEVTARGPGLRVAGAAWDGVGIPACIASGRLAARELL